MRNKCWLLGVIILAGCGGGGDQVAREVSPPPDTTPVSMDRYTESLPLADNSTASAYKILLMGNSHATALQAVLERLLILGQPETPVEVQLAPGWGFLVDRVGDGVSEEKLESEPWSHVILQGQKYSTTGSLTYSTSAAEYWIRGSKEFGATPILFPEHPRKDNTWEGQTLWDLHTGIAVRENTCVAPVGLVWDEVIFRNHTLSLHQADGNHASPTGALLTALVFYQIITGQDVTSLPALGEFEIDSATEQMMKDSVSQLLFVHSACDYEN